MNWKNAFMAIMLMMAPSLQICADSESATLLTTGLTTDRVCYEPGREVIFHLEGIVPDNARVRYRHGAEIVAESELGELISGNSWTWLPPHEDFKGYLTEIYVPEGDGERILGTIGVDVSSQWTRFPRYGFVADFEEYGNPKQKEANIVEEMAYLNRCHMNGVQFQDWHWKHHFPVCFNSDGTVREWYQDVSNRYVGSKYVKRYIEVQHSYGMKSIFYNLCMGAWENATSDGVKKEWSIYAKKSDGSYVQDCHELPSSWQSNIYLENPGNAEWQQYICKRNDEVYENFDFDGYQIDQLGNRSWRSSDGKIYDDNKNVVDLPNGYASFIKAMKERHPTKSLIMNAVSGYGAKNIVETGQLDFCYNEVWGSGSGYGGTSENQFANLYEIIKTNDKFSNHQLRTVFAAYMNYDKAGNSGSTDKLMNTPGVLLTDAVMFALGGGHIELGDHMLSREYFPAKPLAMSEELKTSMIHYYDFLTAYENWLRDNSSKFACSISCTAANELKINTWPPKSNSIVTYAKNVGKAQVVHFLNFLNTSDLSWRDLNGTRPTPSVQKHTPMSIKTNKHITKVWAATPDSLGGACMELDFNQTDEIVTFTLPYLKYWTMVVFESDKVENNIYIVGEATKNNWTISDNAILTPNEDGSIFSGTVHLEAAADRSKTFKFVNGKDYGTCTHYNAEYDKFHFNNTHNISVANLIRNRDTDHKNGAKDYKFTVDKTGNYVITLDLNTMRIYVEPEQSVGIDKTTPHEESTPYYTTAGTQVNKPNKGIYIHKGKKVLLK